MPWLLRAFLAVGAVWLSAAAVDVLAQPHRGEVVTRPEAAGGAERALDGLATVAAPPAGRPSHDGVRFVAVLLALAGGALGLGQVGRLPCQRVGRMRPAPAEEQARPRGPPLLVAP